MFGTFHLPGLWLWMNYLTVMSLNFFSCVVERLEPCGKNSCDQCYLVHHEAGGGSNSFCSLNIKILSFKLVFLELIYNYALVYSF